MHFKDPDILSTSLSLHPRSTLPMGHQSHVYSGKWWRARCGGWGEAEAKVHWELGCLLSWASLSWKIFPFAQPSLGLIPRIAL